MTEYTFTFEPAAEKKFREILGRLEPEEYNVLEDVRPVDHKEGDDIRYINRQAILEMDPESALTFRLGMGNALKIRRKRTEEELAEEKAINDRHTVKITVKVDGLKPEDAS